MLVARAGVDKLTYPWYTDHLIASTEWAVVVAPSSTPAAQCRPRVAPRDGQRPQHACGRCCWAALSPSRSSSPTTSYSVTNSAYWGPRGPVQQPAPAD